MERVKYLGSTYGREGGNKLEITERINKYSQNVKCLYPILKDKHVPLEAKRVIFESILIPSLIYGSEAWVMNTTDRSRIQAAEMRVIRTVLNKTRLDKIRSERLRELVGCEAVLKKIERGQLRWLGHLERMEDSRVARKRWYWQLEGTRPVGRPRKRWKECVEDTLRKNNQPTLQELRHMEAFLDRDGWRGRLLSLTGP